jgi:hypothetical protein
VAGRLFGKKSTVSKIQMAENPKRAAVVPNRRGL